jgi:hypothetical protein
MYVADTGNNLVRQVTPSGQVTTFVGGGTAGFLVGDGIPVVGVTLYAPTSLLTTIDGQTLYLVEQSSCLIRNITTAGGVSTFAGSTCAANVASATDGEALSATFSAGLSSMVQDASGNLFVQDGCSIRKISTSGVVSSFAGNGTCPVYSQTNDGLQTDALIGAGPMTIDPWTGTIYSSDGSRIRKVWYPASQAPATQAPVTAQARRRRSTNPRA